MTDCDSWIDSVAVACRPSARPPVGFDNVSRTVSVPSIRASARIGTLNVFLTSLKPNVSTPLVAV